MIFQVWTSSSGVLGIHLKWRLQKRFGWKKESSKRSASLRKSKTIQNTTVGFEKTSGAEKPAEALPGIIEVILSWILNKASDVVG